MISATTSKPRREDRPERIEIEDDTLVRNDVHARDMKRSPRGHDRDDAKGAPFVLVAGVKYRPVKRYQRWLAGQIKVKNQPPMRRRSRP